MKKLTTKDILGTMADIKLYLEDFSGVDLNLPNGVAIEVSKVKDKFRLCTIDDQTGAVEDMIGMYDHIDEVGFQLAAMYM